MDNIYLFDRYLEDLLPAEEKSNFESRLREDKNLAREFKTYCEIVIGICKEEEQDNKDFEIAMKNISKDELLEIVKKDKKDRIDPFEGIRNNEVAAACASIALEGLEDFDSFTADKASDSAENSPKDSNAPSAKRPERIRASLPAASKAFNFKRWLYWQSAGVAVLLGIAVIYVIIVKNESNTLKQNALAMNQESMQQVDNTIFALRNLDSMTSRDDDLNDLSDEELKAKLPEFEKDFRAETDDQVIVQDGSELALIYIKLHERDKAKELLKELIAKYKDNEAFESDVKNWESIYALLL